MNDKYLNEWNLAIEELSKKEIKYDKLKKEHFEKSEEIIRTTDFKELYGKNNADVRKAHIQNILSELTQDILDLKYSISYLKRKLDWYKAMCDFQLKQ
ncbi:MAG: hypothetical protein J6J36_08185 [Clostridia bacterium]|nr:hypothetical protein [Clostridia bacterium]MBP3708552.1 hypothetical protein [Clostridia bacterium]